MIIKSIKLINFRNHSRYELECKDQTSLILGENGCGKTSILEAIYILMRGKSFRATDSEILKRGEDFYRIELEYIWVHKDYRKNGIGSKLMDKMFSENVSNITLEVRKSNIDAIGLYEKYGFKVVSVRDNYYGSEDAFLMMREMI